MSNLSPEHMTARLVVTEHQSRPYRCPVCGGRGTMPVDFYSQIGGGTSTNPVKCKACGGRGVIIA